MTANKTDELKAKHKSPAYIYKRTLGHIRSERNYSSTSVLFVSATTIEYMRGYILNTYH